LTAFQFPLLPRANAAWRGGPDFSAKAADAAAFDNKLSSVIVKEFIWIGVSEHFNVQNCKRRAIKSIGFTKLQVSPLN